MQRYYHADIRSLGEPLLTWRRLRVLLQSLPDDSVLVRALDPRDAEEQAWTAELQLMAANVDYLSWTVYLLGAQLTATGAFGKRGKNPIPEPTPIPRPGLRDNKQRGKGMKSLVRALGAPV